MTQALPLFTMPPRAQQLFAEIRRNAFVQTDRLFAWLMPIQWLGAVAFALWVSPYAWSGADQSVNPHVWAALGLGGAVTVWPVLCALYFPGRQFTRHVIAAGQMLMSALLIHLAGGRLETHFHIFGSLAFLAFYRDRKVLITATAVIALDHFLRGVYFPLSVFGTLTASPYRWLEHAAWVVFEDIFLMISIGQSLRQMAGVAERQASLEAVNIRIEQTVAERTAELTSEIAEHKTTQSKMTEMHRALVDASRQAGMAEVAINVLHNVGNVLNSVNVSHAIIIDQVRNSEIGSIAKVSNLIAENAGHLDGFLTVHPSGKKLPAYLAKLSDYLTHEQETTLAELHLLGNNIEHIKEIVALQQSHAQAGGMHETVAIEDLVEGAIQVSSVSAREYQINVVRDFAKSPPASLQKHKVIQILVNLLSNAKHSLLLCDTANRQVTIRTASDGQGKLQVSITDTGVGIPSENLTKIFAHGFTTKKDGHGFGLHGSALAATEMGGRLSVQSDGPGKGATFLLEFPANPKAPLAQILP
jgi:signal transduction histidine kinase